MATRSTPQALASDAVPRQPKEKKISVAEKRLAFKKMYDFSGDKETQGVAQKLAEAPQSERKLFVDFVKTIKAYQGDQHFRKKGYLERREAIYKAYDALPQYAKDVIGRPEESIKDLVRGATTKAEAGLNGKVNASFELKITSTGVWGNDTGTRKEYTANEIKSFDDIISFHKAWEIASNLSDTGVVKGSSLDRTDESYQNEFLVTNIKWKDGVS